jgi:hypothetical protein
MNKIINKLINKFNKKLKQLTNKDLSYAETLYMQFMNLCNNFEARITNLKNSKNSSKKKVIYIYDEADHSTFRYRVLNLVEIYQDFEDWEIHLFFLQELQHIINLVEEIDLLILVRTSWTPELEVLLNKVKSKNIKIGYDIDDLLFEENHAKHLVKIDYQSSSNSQKNLLFGYVWRKVIIAKLADFFITTNDFLGAKIKEYFNKEVFIIYNSLNSTQIEYSKYLDSKYKATDKNTKYLGYFSGSSTHNQDFSLISQSLLDLLDKYENVALLVGGFIQLSSEFDKYRERIVKIPYVNFVTQLYYIRKVYINLIPLVENDFTNCKSELKYFESAILKIPSIASPTFVYSSINKRNFKNILLANQGEWTQSIEQLLTNANLYSEVSENALIDSMQYYYKQKIRSQLRQILDNVT